MSKVTKKGLNERLLLVEMLLGLHRELPEQISIDKANDAIFRMQWALSRGKELAETEPKLKQLDQSELTSNDYYHSGIASKLLERGQKLVVCFVSNVSEADALNKKDIEVITSVDTEFNDADDYGWQFVVPINNQGEPLNAADVGL